MPSFTKTLTTILSIFTDYIRKEDSVETLCSKIVEIESFHPRFYPILDECHNLINEKKNMVNTKIHSSKEYCTCGEEDCDSINYNF